MEFVVLEVPDVPVFAVERAEAGTCERREDEKLGQEPRPFASGARSRAWLIGARNRVPSFLGSLLIGKGFVPALPVRRKDCEPGEREAVRCPIQLRQVLRNSSERHCSRINRGHRRGQRQLQVWKVLLELCEYYPPVRHGNTVAADPAIRRAQSLLRQKQGQANRLPLAAWLASSCCSNW